MIQIGRLSAIGKASSNLTQRLPQFLSAISLSIENALAKLDTATRRDGVGEELEIALRAVSALTAGVEQVRGFAETGSQQSLVHRVDLRASLARVVPLLEARARALNTVIRTDLQDELPPVRMAKGDAEQLFFSLIESLMRSADGKRPHRITVSGVVNDQNVELRFSGDEGLIDKESSGMSLDRLLAAERVATPGDLSPCVAWDIAARAGGAIRGRDGDGAGAAFCVMLPISDQVDSQ
jgi:C4-dicarboxylate-specific signal transduction histidine kinase